MKKLLITLLVASSFLFAADMVDPKNNALKMDGVPASCTESAKVSDCMDNTLLEAHVRKNMHKGVESSEFYSELNGDWIGYLKEAWKQSEGAYAVDGNITNNLNAALRSNVDLGEKALRANSELRNSSESFGEYGRMLYFVFKQLFVEYKIESALTQDAFNEAMEEELKNFEEDLSKKT